MFAQIVRRLLIAIPTMLVITAAAFFLMHRVPGGPFDTERLMPPEIESRLKAEYNLDLPIPQQFGLYLAGVVQGDLGPSLKYKDKDVAQIIAEGAPTSAILGLASMTLAVFVGGLLGIFAALGQNRLQDYGVMGLALVGVCLPPLVMGPILQLAAIQVDWPAFGLMREKMTLGHLVLPVITLALPQIAIISRLMRASMIEAMRSNAIRTARAKGMPEWAVIFRHALPVAFLPVVSYLGPALAGVMAGSFVIETLFQLPGIGRQFVIGAQQRDYTLVMGVVILYAGLILLFNLLADVAYGLLDPRARRAA
jgi:oligopeptide transport system permease protein